LPLLYHAVSAIAFAPWLMCENNNAKVKVTSSPLVDGVSFLIESLMSLITCILLVNSITLKLSSKGTCLLSTIRTVPLFSH